MDDFRKEFSKFRFNTSKERTQRKPRAKKYSVDESKERARRVTQFQNIRRRALERGLEFDIHPDDISWPTHCPILGFQLVRGYADVGLSPTIDRINPKQGYTKNNVRVISRLANTMKADATREQIEIFCRNIFPYLDGKL